MRSICVLIVLYWGSWTLVAQPTPDQIALLSSTQDTSEIAQIQDAIKKLASSKPEQTIDLANTSLLASERNSYDRGKARAYFILALGYDYGGKLDSAVKYYDWAKESYLQQDNLYDATRMLLNKGVAFQYVGDNANALTNYLQTYELAQANGFKLIQSKVLNNIGILYRSFEEYDKALEAYTSSISLKKELKDSAGLANSYHNKGLAHSFLNEDTLALSSMQVAKQLYEKLGNTRGLIETELGIGTVLFKLKQNKKAIRTLEPILQTPNLKVDKFIHGNALLALGKAYTLETNYEASLNYLLRGWEITNPTNRKALKSSYCYHISNCYYRLGNLKLSRDFLQEHVRLDKEVFNQERTRAEQEMKAKFETLEKDHQLEIQAIELAQNQNERNFFIAIAILSLIVLIAALLLARNKIQSNKILQSKNTIITKALKEKDVLVKEIHHRVKNNLQVVSSLLSIQSRYIDDPKALNVMQEGRNRVQSMVLIHQNLYQGENLVEINAKEYIEKLTAYLINSYQVDVNQITVSQHIDSIELDVDVLIPIGLILNELISNSLKYAFQDQEHGTIEVQLKNNPDGLALKVADNGKGMPEHFDIQQSRSMGFRLIHAFVNKLKASLKIENAKGTNVEILIPQNTFIHAN